MLALSGSWFFFFPSSSLDLNRLALDFDCKETLLISVKRDDGPNPFSDGAGTSGTGKKLPGAGSHREGQCLIQIKDRDKFKFCRIEDVWKWDVRERSVLDH